MDEKRMPLREHLEELRTCLWRSLLGFAVLFFVSFAFVDPLIDFIVWP